MVKIFLDTNVFIDVIKRRIDAKIVDFDKRDIYISPLSIHILTYVYKSKIPDADLSNIPAVFNIVTFTQEIAKKALLGPTSDFEDNVQLHSAVECDVFLTSDKQLLEMKFFGKTRILSDMPK